MLPLQKGHSFKIEVMASLFRRKILANSWVDENTYSLRLPKSHSHRLSRLYKRLLPASVSRRTEVYFACITCSTQSVNGRRFSLSINSLLCLMLEAKVFTESNEKCFTKREAVRFVRLVFEKSFLKEKSQLFKRKAPRQKGQMFPKSPNNRKSHPAPAP